MKINVFFRSTDGNYDVFNPPPPTTSVKLSSLLFFPPQTPDSLNSASNHLNCCPPVDACFCLLSNGRRPCSQAPAVTRERCSGGRRSLQTGFLRNRCGGGLANSTICWLSPSLSLLPSLSSLSSIFSLYGERGSKKKKRTQTVYTGRAFTRSSRELR